MPNINGATEKEQLAQIRSYLYQFVPQLQWALSNVETAGSSNYVVQQTTKGNAAGDNSPVDAVATFNAIKSLIIKSADIVTAFYEQVTERLEGVYVAESDFGVYAERTTQDITKNSTEIKQVFKNVQAIVTDIEGIGSNTITVNACVKTGLLYYLKNGVENMQDGTPIYGVEVGQRVEDSNGNTVFNKFARFTSSRLSFYDQNDQEVAYVSDYKLYIRNVEITSSYKIGGFVDTVMASGDVVTKWVGGNS
jgi:hypothetical protein